LHFATSNSITAIASLFGILVTKNQSPFSSRLFQTTHKSYLHYSETLLQSSVAHPFSPSIQPFSQGNPENFEFMSTQIENLKSYDPFAEADDDSGQTKQTQEYIHIRIQQRNGRKTLTTVQGIPSKFDHKKILKVIKKEFACNGTIISDSEMGEVIQLQGDQRSKIREFLVDSDGGLGLDEKTIKVHGF
jgi:translation initiation factor 1